MACAIICDSSTLSSPDQTMRGSRTASTHRLTRRKKGKDRSKREGAARSRPRMREKSRTTSTAEAIGTSMRVMPTLRPSRRPAPGRIPPPEPRPVRLRRPRPLRGVPRRRSTSTWRAGRVRAPSSRSPPRAGRSSRSMGPATSTRERSASGTSCPSRGSGRCRLATRPLVWGVGTTALGPGSHLIFLGECAARRRGCTRCASTAQATC